MGGIYWKCDVSLRASLRQPSPFDLPSHGLIVSAARKEGHVVRIPTFISLHSHNLNSSYTALQHSPCMSGDG